MGDDRAHRASTWSSSSTSSSLPEPALERFFYAYGLVPADFSWVAALTSMFVHGGWLHIGGNMLSLWIFGDNVEDRMGHGRFLAVLPARRARRGARANLAADPGSPLPLVGASGAIAGVMGAYFVLFPHSRILVLVFLIFFVDVVEIPARALPRLLVSDADPRRRRPRGAMPAAASRSGRTSADSSRDSLGVLVFRRPERQRVDWWSAT